MQTITKEFIQQYISNQKINLACTQPKLCIPIIDRIYKKMIAGIEFSEIKIEGSQICDGHHRYIASLLAGIKIGSVPSSSTSATKVTIWEEVIFVEEDWDTAEKIKMLNEVDANFNKLSIEEVEAILE